MFGLFRRKPPNNTAAIIEELKHVYAEISKLNIPVVADDVDAGYDMAIDETLDIINDRIRHYLMTPTTENT